VTRRWRPFTSLIATPQQRSCLPPLAAQKAAPGGGSSRMSLRGRGQLLLVWRQRPAAALRRRTPAEKAVTPPAGSVFSTDSLPPAAPATCPPLALRPAQCPPWPPLLPNSLLFRPTSCPSQHAHTSKIIIPACCIQHQHWACSPRRRGHFQ
jgi:hypothetical protein